MQPNLLSTKNSKSNNNYGNHRVGAYFQEDSDDEAGPVDPKDALNKHLKELANLGSELHKLAKDQKV